ncbi:MAG: type II toxin-antitoxin system VapC family toxin [Novosphingobium sp.]|nr:type II toxin-antitoxin system VapC family toxin [Novosphingobium sp.]
MKLLLDTHVLLWWLRDDPRLSGRARSVIAAPNVAVLVSIGSLWELSIKCRIGKIEESGARVLRETIGENFAVLDVTAAHLAALEGFPRVAPHNDPFDHLILAQAQAEMAIVMTGDRIMTRYGVPCIGVG